MTVAVNTQLLDVNNFICITHSLDKSFKIQNIKHQSDSKIYHLSLEEFDNFVNFKAVNSLLFKRPILKCSLSTLYKIFSVLNNSSLQLSTAPAVFFNVFRIKELMSINKPEQLTVVSSFSVSMWQEVYSKSLSPTKLLIDMPHNP
jgi:hypothetical protein